MTQKSQNRKLILQQLLQKSQLFNEYLKNESNINSILNLSQSKKNQFLQFGKCEINLPERVKQPPSKFTANKIMVLTKNKKEALRIKEKYQNLQKLRQTQIVNLEITQTHSQRKTISEYSKRQANTEMKNFSRTKNVQGGSNLPTPIRTPQNPETYEFLNDHRAYELSPEQKNNITQLKCKTKEFISKNRSSSAKVRPQFDFFLRNNSNRSETVDRYICDSLNSERKLDPISSISKQQNLPSDLADLQKPENVIEPEANLQTDPTQQQFQQPYISTSFEPSSSTIQQNSPQRRSSSFSIKRHPNNATPSLFINKNYQQNFEQNKKNKINFRRELHKTYKRAFIPPPKISAKAYAVYEVKQEGFQQSGKILSTINGKMAQQVASLTKIMTCIVVLEIAKKYTCNLEEEFLEIGKFQTNITGTSALLKTGEIYSVQQLLYGLMLPSGNDASLALGVWGGKVLLTNSSSKLQAIGTSGTSQPVQQQVYDPLKKYYKKDYIQRFVEEMNIKAHSLNMTRTHYANTHGLVNNENKSAAIDIALLCEYVMTNEKFAQIVGTKVYESVIKYKQFSVVPNSTQPFALKPRQIRFQNTHYLLHKKPHEYIGVKTGVTTAAGPCLASYIWNKQTNRKFIIVVLDCKSMMMRFKQTEILKKWLYKQENIPIKVKKFKPRTMSLREDHNSTRSQLQDAELNSDGDQDYSEEKCED